MAILDPSRATFVSSEYRYFTATDNPTLSTYANARIVEIDSNMDETAATALANTVLAEWKVAKRNYEITLLQALRLEDLTTAPPSFTLTDARSNAAAVPARTLNVKMNYKLGTSTVTVRAG